ncbi:uncharacterized protein YgiB involved in biofilm formation [Pseudomonas protegens]|uniref:DUF1190 domain-containing protein n=1 Tax=Pseudomonas TaxID=286 RepID=UPI00088F7668|nr:MULTISPECIES: DUF1190 domain-containing protein [Pseudomonas]MBF0641539.1 DUF1190 domain-containing protein [Pseudomonas protegens]MDT3423140.1 uncharacterized protein YgiB involved in biofilm formation [Pseudomonas protegens]ROM32216.1 hypothetical protein BK644_03225 [Pseudomonas protegens]SDA28550.1 Uncharacterized conserved protein YgiB, involved in bioifilm formation, UPF0441/DUF1190 family [Pseudomonas sp. NFPP12]SEM18839.1 Uncharacterized conserved protein YgiB, involved in bioifilm 
MKRSKSVRLVLLGSVPFALAACDGQPQATREVRQTQNFSSVSECERAQIPSAICQAARDDARERGERVAPRYLDLQRCEEDFVTANCMVSRDNRAYVPISSGFALTSQRTVPDKPEEEQQTSSSGGGGGGGGSSSGSRFWRWIGLDSTPEPRYFSEALYKQRDGRGGTQLSTLSQQVEAGKTFSGASGGRFGISSPEHFTSAGNPLAGAHEVVSRSGFGSSSRSSWSFGS